MQRDIQRNQTHPELIDILAEVYEDMDDADQELWSEIDVIHEDTDLRLVT